MERRQSDEGSSKFNSKRRTGSENPRNRCTLLVISYFFFVSLLEGLFLLLPFFLLSSFQILILHLRHPFLKRKRAKI